MGDVNLDLAGLLLDLAEASTDEHRQLGYTRAARTVLKLETFVAPLVEANTFTAVPGIGRTTDRIARELLFEGRSAYVDRVVTESGRQQRVAAKRRLRHGFLSRAAIREILDRPVPPALDAYHGDLQMHSVWSDGAESLDVMADECLSRGYAFCAMTDHSHGLPIAGGMTMEQVAAQQTAIDAVNRARRGRFRMLKGIEANILADGTLDLSAEEARQFELIVASPHSLLRKETDQTERMVRAVSQPGVAILGHPQGRRFNARPGVSADWDKVFEVAAQRRVAIEIDGSWDRQDVSYELAARALEHGCIFALDSDAHATGELRFAEVAIAHARLAAIPATAIVNYWSARRLLAWAKGARNR